MELIFLSGACIIHKNKTLLLQQPAKGRHPNLWGPPGGHREKNESLLEAAVREVKEETNLDIKIEGLIESGIKIHADGKISLIALYLAKPLNLRNIKMDPSEIADYKWVSLEEIIKDKYLLRDPLLKTLLIKAITQKTAPVDTFKIY